jgi:hypothetical protein
MYLLVALVALAVGALVYLTSLRAGPVAGDGGFGTSDAQEPPRAPVGGTYLPVTTARPDWQTRLTGLLGLLIVVVVGSIVLAVTLYVAVSLLVGVISGGGTADVTPSP